MGLFSAKKKITVGSSLYNLAGAIEDRVQYLPTVINTKIIAGTAQSIGGVIQSSLISGPGMRVRGYARWARKNGYANRIGLKTGKLSVGSNINLALLAGQIPHAAGEEVIIQTAEIGIADYGFWVDQWMLANHPTEIGATYEIDFDEQANVISIIEGDVVKYSFQPVNFDDTAEYLYVSYQLVKRNQAGPVVNGSKIQVTTQADLPSTAGYTLVSTTPLNRSVDYIDRVVTVITYSDGRPGSTTTVDTPHTDLYTEYTYQYEKREFTGASPDGSSTNSIRHILYHYTGGYTVATTNTVTTPEDIGGGVTKTTKVTTTTRRVGFQYFYRKSTQAIVVSQWSPMHVLIYKEGDGNAVYDKMFNAAGDMGSFLAPIPLRRWGSFLGPDNFPELYTWTTKAVKKSMDKKIGYIVDQLKDNPSIGDIDFAYLVFGVSLNTREKSGKKYIYKFFESLNERGAGGTAEYQAWRTAWDAANTKQQTWAAWKIAQGVPTDPLYGTTEPPQAVYPAQPLKQLKVYADRINFNMTVNWTGIAEVKDVPGLGRPGAKVGDLWFVQNSQDTFQELLVSAGNLDDRVLVNGMVTLYWQDKADSFRALGISGLHHTNIVYKGKGVDIDGIQALNDTEESGFIIPLHEGVLRSMSLKDSTQLCTSNMYMVLNYYQVTKQKWYQSSWFKIVLIIIVIVIIVVTAGTGTPAAGVLGTAASVGASVGLAGTAAIIAGAAINAITGLIIANLITRAAVALFGPEVGAIVGAIASVVVLSIGTSLANGGTASAGLQSMTSAANLTKMTVAAGNGYAAAAAGKLEDLGKDVAELEQNYKSEIMTVYNAWTENLGFNNSTIDLQELTESAKVDYLYENVDVFLARTLWTGSDIAGITNGLIGGFTEASLTTVLP